MLVHLTLVAPPTPGPQRERPSLKRKRKSLNRKTNLLSPTCSIPPRAILSLPQRNQRPSPHFRTSSFVLRTSLMTTSRSQMRNLLVHLRARGPAELRRIADCWGVPLTGRTTDDHVAHLYRTMRDPWTVRDRAETLTPAEWAIVEPSSPSRPIPGCSPATPSPPPPANPRDAFHRCGSIPHSPAASSPPTRPPTLSAYRANWRPPSRGFATSACSARRSTPTTPLRGLLATLEGGELEEAAEAWGLRVTPGTVSREA